MPNTTLELYQAKLQQNLTFLAKLADVGPQAGPQAQTYSQ
ncbi:hypothetical protein A2U01_0062879, partial [Trifolium medium]|nr:hypothetical protein [Trifolium medium]